MVCKHCGVEVTQGWLWMHRGQWYYCAQMQQQLKLGSAGAVYGPDFAFGTHAEPITIGQFVTNFYEKG